MEPVLEAVRNTSNKLGYIKLEKQQQEVILNFMTGNDVFAVLPTGFGKSLCYTCLPDAFDFLLGCPGFSIVIVVSPLTAIMKDQVSNSN